VCVPVQFRKVYQSCLNFVSGDLSSFYLDTAKDRMYIQARDSSSRRACQTVQAAVLQVRGGVEGEHTVCAYVCVGGGDWDSKGGVDVFVLCTSLHKGLC